MSQLNSGDENPLADEEEEIRTFYFVMIPVENLSPNEFRDYALECLPHLKYKDAGDLLTDDALQDMTYRRKMLHLIHSKFNCVS